MPDAPRGRTASQPPVSLLARARRLQLAAIHRVNARHLTSCGADSVVAARIVRHGGGGRIEVGNYCHLRGHLITWRPDSRIVFGDNILINARSVIESFGSVTIGSDTLFGFDVLVGDGRGHSTEWADRVDDQHGYRRPETVDATAIPDEPIEIGQGCWIAARAIILPGVTIGEGSTVAAASVVTKSVPPFSVVAGNPARVVRELEHRRPPGR